MTDRTCPLCAGNGHVDLSYWLPRQQRLIFEAVLKRPRTCRDLQDVLYADDPSGGPENAERVVWAQVNNLNSRLAPHGLRVRATFGRSARYRIERLHDAVKPVAPRVEN